MCSHAVPRPAGLHASARCLGPSSPHLLSRGEVAPSLHCCCSSLWYRLHRTHVLVPCPAGDGVPACALPRVAPCSGFAGREALVPSTARRRGHHLPQPHNLPQNSSLEEATGGLGVMKGRVAFLVFRQTFFTLFMLLSLPRAAGQSCGDTSPQLPAQGTHCNCPFWRLFP